MGNNNLKFFLLILLSLAIIVFGARGIFYSITENNETLDVKQQDLESKKETLNKLEQLNKKIKDSKIENVEMTELKKYIHEIKEDELLEYFYSYVNNSRTGSGYMILNSVSFDVGSKNEYGFMEGKINLNLTLSDEGELFKIIDFVTSKDSYYKFFIDNFSFPNDKQTGSFNISIPLRVFYK